MSKGFAVPSSYYENPKPNPWCIYAGPIKARRWTKFGGIPLELLDILHLRCEVLFCATLDGLIPRDLSTEEQKCYDVSIVIILNVRADMPRQIVHTRSNGST